MRETGQKDLLPPFPVDVAAQEIVTLPHESERVTAGKRLPGSAGDPADQRS